jgi:hypothetical protein
MEPRPLTIGELLDRAITLYTRRFVALFAAYALVWIPLLVLNSLAHHDTLGLFGDLQRLFTLPASDVASRTKILREINAATSLNGWAGVTLAVSAIVVPLGNNAVLLTAAGFLNGVPVSLGVALRRAVQLWVPAIVVTLLAVGIGIVVFGIAMIGLFLLAFAIGLLAVASKVAALVLGVVFGIGGLLIAAILAAVIYVIMGMGYVGLVLEQPNPFRAIGLALRRCLDRRLLTRTILVGLAYGAVQFVGIYAFVGLGLVTSELLHLSALYVLFVTGGGAVLNILLLVFMLLYTRDVRVRREGADLLQAAGTPPPL